MLVVPLGYITIIDIENMSYSVIDEPVEITSWGAGTGQAFIDVQDQDSYTVNALYLLTHALHETGDGTSRLASGDPYNGKICYSMFGINANDDPYNLGMTMACQEEWYTPEDAIKGGAAWIENGYTSNGQDTLYKMKWNPDNPGVHQYVTHIQRATLQAQNLAEIVAQTGETPMFDFTRYKE